jgi:hypothetical protein
VAPVVQATVPSKQQGPCPACGKTYRSAYLKNYCSLDCYRTHLADRKQEVR